MGKNKFRLFFVLLVLVCAMSVTSAKAQTNSFVMYPSYVQIQQGGTTQAIITGSNLNKPVIEIVGSDISAFITEPDPAGLQFKVQFYAKPNAQTGEREFIVRNQNNLEGRFLIQVLPSGIPVIESIFPDSANPDSTFFLKIFGMGFTQGTLVTTLDAGFIINSFASTPDGSVLVLSVSLASDILPGTHKIYIENAGQQAQADFTVTSAAVGSDLFNADPYSPGIYSIEVSPANKNQIIIKGAMFDADPYENVVTLLEVNNQTTIGRQIDIISSSNNELIVNLPPDINSESISIAVTNKEGISNVKSLSLAEVLNETPVKADINTGSGDSSATITLTSTDHQAQNNTVINKPDSNIVALENNHDVVAKASIEDITPINNAEEKPVSLDDQNALNKNIQNISQYLFNAAVSGNAQITPSISEIKDPAKLINAIEENKQIKNQLELITSTLNEVKQNNKELSESIKKADDLKNKVEELDKLLNTEKQKNRPDPKKVAQYQKLLATANAESRSQTFTLLNKLLKHKPQLKNLLAQRPLDLAAVQPNIPDNSVILQYVPTEEGLIIFVVDNKNLKTRINKNISQDILNREVQSYKSLFEKEIEKINQTGRVTQITSWKKDNSTAYKKDIQPLKEKIVFLYNALIEPIEKDIANKNVIAIIANGWLRYLPFQSLASPTKEGDLQFLISEKSIVYLDSVLALSRNKLDAISSSANITVFANPDGTLDGANKEAEVITKLFNKTVKAFVKKPFDVTLVNQAAKNADILHLATHGYLDVNDINSSFIVSGKKYTGKSIVPTKLFLKDIYDLNLQNSKLVVLSGCDTGKVGSLSSEPDDILGSLATAFRVAGANTIIASLWKAHDDATRIIMNNLYENILHGLNKAEALRRAELKVKENPKYGHPLFWALFNLIGDWR